MHLKTQFAEALFGEKGFVAEDVLVLQADGTVVAGWDELAAQSDWVAVFLVLAAGQSLISGCAEQSPPQAAVLPLRSVQEHRCGLTGFLVAVLDCLSCQRQGGFWATRVVVVEQGETEGCSERNFEIDVAGFFGKELEGWDVEGGFVEQTVVWQEEVGLCAAVGEEQEQTCD